MKRTISSILVIVFMCFIVTGCQPIEKTADQIQAQQTSRSLKEANSQIGMPAIKNFQERKLAKMIFELRDQEKLVTFAYLVNLDGQLVFIGKCIGFGLPYSVQYTSPQKLVDRFGRPMGGNGTYDPHPMPQADPNGLFMPDGLSATWLMMIDPKTGDARPVYVEPQIIVSPFALHQE